MKQTKTFTEWWQGLGPAERDQITVGLAEACKVSLITVQSWGRGYRVPRLRVQETITEYVHMSGMPAATPQTLFPCLSSN